LCLQLDWVLGKESPFTSPPPLARYGLTTDYGKHCGVSRQKSRVSVACKFCPSCILGQRPKRRERRPWVRKRSDRCCLRPKLCHDCTMAGSIVDLHEINDRNHVVQLTRLLPAVRVLPSVSQHKSKCQIHFCVVVDVVDVIVAVAVVKPLCYCLSSFVFIHSSFQSSVKRSCISLYPPLEFMRTMESAVRSRQYPLTRKLLSLPERIHYSLLFYFTFGNASLILSFALSSESHRHPQRTSVHDGKAFGYSRTLDFRRLRQISHPYLSNRSIRV
jgi:hypothetical protein